MGGGGVLKGVLCVKKHPFWAWFPQLLGHSNLHCLNVILGTLAHSGQFRALRAILLGHLVNSWPPGSPGFWGHSEALCAFWAIWTIVDPLSQSGPP